MLPEPRQDRSALRWIRNDLDQTLREARTALEDFAEGQQERLQECIDRLHHVHGVLEMVQVYGAAMLADEMEKLALALASGSAKNVNNSAEALMLGMVQLPAYLEKIEAGGADVPLVLLPFMNDLRSAYDSPLVSETSLFAPKLDAVIAAETVRPGSGNRELPQLIRQRRSFYHRGLLNVIRGQNAEAGLHQLRDVIDALNTAAGTARLRRLLGAGEALVIVQTEDDEPPSLAVKLLLGKLDRVFKQILDQGEEAAMLGFPIELLKNILYYIARSNSTDAAVVAVRQAADVVNTFPETPGSAGVVGSLGGPDREMFAAVGEALAEDLRSVKDQLDLFMRSDRSQPERVTGLAEPIQRIGDTLGMVGRGDLRTRLKRRCDELRSAELAGESLPDDSLMTLASDLLFVESSLASLASGEALPVDFDEPMEGAVTQSLSEGEMQLHLRAAVDEAMVEIAKIKDGILQYLEDPDQHSLLNEVPQRLHSVAGAMRILELPEASRLLTDLKPYIAELADGSRPAPGIAQRDALADVVIGAECYMQAAVEPGDDLERILAYAEKALEHLGLGASGELGAEATTVAGDELQDIGTQVESEDSSGGAAFVETLDDGLSEPLSVVEPGGEVEASAPPAASAEQEPVETSATLGSESVESTPPAQAATPVQSPSADVDSEILEIFGEEAEEELQVIQDNYPKWRDDLDDRESLTTIRRSFHTLKGSGRLVGAINLGEFSWSIENLLNRVIDGTVNASSDVMRVLDEAVDVLPKLVEESRDFNHAGTDVSALSGRAFSIAAGEQPAPREAETAPAADKEDAADSGEESDGGGEADDYIDLASELSNDAYDVEEHLDLAFDESIADTPPDEHTDAATADADQDVAVTQTNAAERKPIPERIAEAEARVETERKDSVDEAPDFSLLTDVDDSLADDAAIDLSESLDDLSETDGPLVLEPLDETGETSSEEPTPVDQQVAGQLPSDSDSPPSSLLTEPPDESILTLTEAEDSAF